MPKKKDLLIEIGTEELPPQQLLTLINSFKESFSDELSKNKLNFAEIKPFITPRRIALQILQLDTQQPIQKIEKSGPNLKIALDENGNPTNAGKGFAKTCGVSFDKLTHLETPKGKVLHYESEQPGEKASELIPEILQSCLHALPIAKRMHWGNLQESFIRPVHWLVVLFDKEVIDCAFFGIKSDRYTFGHRFHANNRIALKNVNDYEKLLLSSGKVVACHEKRSKLIQDETQKLAKSMQGQAKLTNDLLALINGLVEYPVVLSGEFSPSFLELPREVLISVMIEHQKYFPVIDESGNLLNNFIIVSNIQSKKPEVIISGNQKVMNARLADAQFHFKQDQKTSLISKTDKLSAIIFEKNLGSISEKSQRVLKLSCHIASLIGAKVDVVERAAILSKADLVSNMVGEFPELQGIMGSCYARIDGEPKEVALAIKEHYQPRHATDSLPSSLPGVCLSLADKIDTLVGLFAVNKHPKADKDPFALRRQAFAILKIILEKSLLLKLDDLFEFALQNFNEKIISQNPDVIPELLNFCFERLKSLCSEKNIPPRVFSAVLAKKVTSPFDFYCRAKSVAEFQSQPMAIELSEINKRVKNILQKANMSKLLTQQINQSLLSEKAEQNLIDVMVKKEQILKPLIKQTDYRNILLESAKIKPEVDSFFESVMVMVDDEQLKLNRLLILQKLRTLFTNVADISLL